MKKFISSLAILTMMLSMFAGISFADVDTKIVLDTDYVMHERGFMTISGRIVNKDTNATMTRATNEIYVSAAGSTFSTNADRGRFTLTFSLPVGEYTIRGYADGDINTPDSSIFRVIPELVLDSGSTLDFDYPVSGQKIVQGEFVEGNGRDYSSVEIAYVDESDNSKDQVIASAIIHTDDAFGFMIDSSKMNKAGKIGIFVGSVLALEGEIKAPELSVSLSSYEIPRGVIDYPLTATFNLHNDFLKSDGDLDATIVFSISELGWSQSASSFDNVRNQRIDVEFDHRDTEDWALGYYNLTIELREGFNKVGEKTERIRVVRPDDYTLIGWSLDNVTVGDIKFSMPDSTETSGNNADYPSVASNNIDQQIQVKDDTGYDMRFFEVDVKGAGVDKTFTNFGSDKVDGDMFTITPKETGAIDFIIRVYSSATSTSPVKTFNREVNISGYNVSISPSQVQADSRDDIVFIITDEDGNAVNNASVYINNTRVVNGNTANIQNGRYVYPDDREGFFGNVGGLNVEIRGWLHDTYLTVQFENAIQVVGDEVYTVTSSKQSLVNGFEDTIYVTTKENREIIFPDKIERIDVDKDGKLSSPVTLTGRGYSDRDNDGVREAIELRLTPNNTQKAVIIRMSTDDGKKMGEVTINVTGPNVEMLKAESATENFRTNFEFKAVDPRDDSNLNSYVYFVADREYVDYSLRDGNNSNISVNSSGVSSSRRPNRNDIYQFEVFVNDVDWDKAESDKEDVVISVYAETSGDDIKLFDIPVKKATLTSDPTEIIIGSQARTFIFTYVDGDGNPLEGYEVFLNDTLVGETDDLGQVSYNTSVAGMTLLLEAETDDTKDDSNILNPSSRNTDTLYTEARIRAVADTQGPTASAPATVFNDSVVITIKDNGAVNRAMINNKPIDIFFPQPTITEIYSGLKPGLNTIIVEAVDLAGNYGKTELKVAYETGSTTPEPPAGEVTFTIGKASPYGTPLLRDGTTMVPVRFAESLGATFEWDNIAKKATYKLGDRTIEVTIGAEFAKVNGDNVLMTEKAYLNDQGRTMVPVRLIAQELGFVVNWTSNTAPISIVPAS